MFAVTNLLVLCAFEQVRPRLVARDGPRRGFIVTLHGFWLRVPLADWPL